MVNDFGFCVYRAKHFFNMSPLVIITAGIEDKITLYSEYFILLREKNTIHYFPSRINYKGDTDQCKIFGIDKEFMYNEALNYANAKLSNFLYEKYELTKDSSYIQRDFELIKQTQSELIGSYLRGEFDESYRKVQMQSLSGKLREYLNLILKLPKMTTIDKI
jgi:hypothetical protein